MSHVMWLEVVCWPVGFLCALPDDGIPLPSKASCDTRWLLGMFGQTESNCNKVDATCEGLPVLMGASKGGPFSTSRAHFRQTLCHAVCIHIHMCAAGASLRHQAARHNQHYPLELQHHRRHTRLHCLRQQPSIPRRLQHPQLRPRRHCCAAASWLAPVTQQCQRLSRPWGGCV
jgi:hypothetical protein